VDPPTKVKLTKELLMFNSIRLKRLTVRRFMLLLLVTLVVNAQALWALAQGDVATAVTYSGGMGSQAIMTVSTTVVALTQFVKWGSFVSDQRGPLVVLVLSLFGVVFWGWTTGDLARATAFGYLAGFIAVATSAAGIYGFTRSGPAAITSTTTPPSGAGASPTN
jgi:hypothetical protein